ncbi:TetR family transcriptional regulator [Allobranchiibius huperziae]|uniref:AcrR family transcriptional regulator n=1 Tax=Allobranchiibius huperziae TaxID=1874116 RepID=A0A853DF62_9MICO|nr:TetR family transcriptional regulator [Allobranchiibius huperziae]NYJ75448.1 AcrR family transcriptional regulator [Allobranchiibius huperziae]
MAISRRHPEPQARVRDAERSRAALLDAAQTEFAEKGLAGARVDAIATRAGVNKQLIAYYFGGKRGLYDAVTARRREFVADFDTPDTSLPDLAMRYFYAFADNPDLERIFLRENLDRDPADVVHDPDSAEVADLRRRQESGELAHELDPAFVLLFLEAMTVSGTLFAAEAKRLTGHDPRSSEFRDRAAEQVREIVRRLA